MPDEDFDNEESEEKTQRESVKKTKHKKPKKGQKIEYLAPWQYKKGQSGNPSGMPKGTQSMKVWLRNKMIAMSDEEREEFITGLNKLELIKLAEGNPAQDSTVAITGKLEVDIESKKKIDEALENFIVKQS